MNVAALAAARGVANRRRSEFRVYAGFPPPEGALRAESVHGLTSAATRRGGSWEASTSAPDAPCAHERSRPASAGWRGTSRRASTDSRPRLRGGQVHGKRPARLRRRAHRRNAACRMQSRFPLLKMEIAVRHGMAMAVLAVRGNAVVREGGVVGRRRRLRHLPVDGMKIFVEANYNNNNARDNRDNRNRSGGARDRRSNSNGRGRRPRHGICSRSGWFPRRPPAMRRETRFCSMSS